MSGKIDTAQCVAAIESLTHIRGWKRGRKHSWDHGIARTFRSKDFDGECVVYEKDGTITSVHFFYPGSIVPPTPGAPGKKSKPKVQYYFDEDDDCEDSQQARFWIVEKSFWDEHHCMDDRGLSHQAPEGFMPSGFSEDAESLFSYGSYFGPEWEMFAEKGRKALLKHGLLPLPAK